MTYGIHSAGIRDVQKREIVERVGLPRNHKRQLWVRPGYTVRNGKIYAPKGDEQVLAVHLQDDWEVV